MFPRERVRRVSVDRSLYSFVNPSYDGTDSSAAGGGLFIIYRFDRSRGFPLFLAAAAAVIRFAHLANESENVRIMERRLEGHATVVRQ